MFTNILDPSIKAWAVAFTTATWSETWPGTVLYYSNLWWFPKEAVSELGTTLYQCVTIIYSASVFTELISCSFLSTGDTECFGCCQGKNIRTFIKLTSYGNEHCETMKFITKFLYFTSLTWNSTLFWSYYELCKNL